MPVNWFGESASKNDQRSQGEMTTLWVGVTWNFFSLSWSRLIQIFSISYKRHINDFVLSTWLTSRQLLSTHLIAKPFTPLVVCLLFWHLLFLTIPLWLRFQFWLKTHCLLDSCSLGVSSCHGILRQGWWSVLVYFTQISELGGSNTLLWMCLCDPKSIASGSLRSSVTKKWVD